MLKIIDRSFSASLMSPLAFSSRTGRGIFIESSTKEGVYRCHVRNVPSEPHEKFPESNLRARYFLFPPWTLTVWILRGPIYENRAVLTFKWHKQHKKKKVFLLKCVSVTMTCPSIGEPKALNQNGTKTGPT